MRAGESHAHRRSRVLIAALLLGFALAGCAAGPNGFAHTANGAGLVAGYWRGLWHGLIAPCTFLLSLFSDNVGVYEIHNNGRWYNFGFLSGLILTHGGTASRRKRA